MRSWVRMGMAALALPLWSGCYAYHPIERVDITPGATVRVAVQREEAVRQIDALGGLRERVEGQVAPQTNGNTLALTVRQAATPAMTGRFNAYVTLPWGSLDALEVKRFSPRRTALAAAGAGVVTFAALSVIDAITEGNKDEPPSTNDAVRIPLLRIRW